MRRSNFDCRRLCEYANLTWFIITPNGPPVNDITGVCVRANNWGDHKATRSKAGAPLRKFESYIRMVHICVCNERTVVGPYLILRGQPCRDRVAGAPNHTQTYTRTDFRD